MPKTGEKIFDFLIIPYDKNLYLFASILLDSLSYSYIIYFLGDEKPCFFSKEIKKVSAFLSNRKKMETFYVCLFRKN